MGKRSERGNTLSIAKPVEFVGAKYLLRERSMTLLWNTQSLRGLPMVDSLISNARDAEITCSYGTANIHDKYCKG